jgi:nitrite reductase/ring-hydroxylating ferredoxin subunit
MSGDDRRRVACGPERFIAEGAIISVPIFPSFSIDDPDLGKVQVRGALIARRFGALHVYANVCRHIPLTLDLGDGEVAAQDRGHFLCHHHGARYRIVDGRCASGPCDGEALFPLDHAIVDGELFLILPPPIA